MKSISFISVFKGFMKKSRYKKPIQSPCTGYTSANWYNQKESHSEQIYVEDKSALFTALNLILS